MKQKISLLASWMIFSIGCWEWYASNGTTTKISTIPLVTASSRNHNGNSRYNHRNSNLNGQSFSTSSSTSASSSHSNNNKHSTNNASHQQQSTNNRTNNINNDDDQDNPPSTRRSRRRRRRNGRQKKQPATDFDFYVSDNENEEQRVISALERLSTAYPGTSTEDEHSDTDSTATTTSFSESSIHSKPDEYSYPKKRRTKKRKVTKRTTISTTKSIDNYESDNKPTRTQPSSNGNYTNQSKNDRYYRQYHDNVDSPYNPNHKTRMNKVKNNNNDNSNDSPRRVEGGSAPMTSTSRQQQSQYHQQQQQQQLPSSFSQPRSTGTLLSTDQSNPMKHTTTATTTTTTTTTPRPTMHRSTSTTNSNPIRQSINNNSHLSPSSSTGTMNNTPWSVQQPLSRSTASPTPMQSPLSSANVVRTTPLSSQSKRNVSQQHAQTSIRSPSLLNQKQQQQQQTNNIAVTPTATTGSNNDQLTSTTPWVRRYLASHPKDALLPVPRDYIADGFNLAQLAPVVNHIGMEALAANNQHSINPLIEQSMHSNILNDNNVSTANTVATSAAATSTTTSSSTSYPIYREALRLLLQDDDDDNNHNNNMNNNPVVQRAAEALYLFIHARYVMSPRGLDTIRRVLKTRNVEPVFGRCARIGCHGMPLLPFGDYENYDLRRSRTTRCKRYCCCCGETFYLWESKVDGCAWGPSFCHLFLMTYGNEVFPDLAKHRQQFATKIQPDATIMGFQLHPATLWGQKISSSSSSIIMTSVTKSGSKTTMSGTITKNVNNNNNRNTVTQHSV